MNDNMMQQANDLSFADLSFEELEARIRAEALEERIELGDWIRCGCECIGDCCCFCNR